MSRRWAGIFGALFVIGCAGDWVVNVAMSGAGATLGRIVAIVCAVGIAVAVMVHERHADEATDGRTAYLARPDHERGSMNRRTLADCLVLAAIVTIVAAAAFYAACILTGSL